MKENHNKKGIVYVLTNDFMPGIIKIGQTKKTVEERIKELDRNSALPQPFRFHFAIESDRYLDIEKLAHNAFDDHRVRKNREFFKIDPERAVAALKISGCTEIKLANDMIDDAGQVIDESNSKQKRENFSFDKHNIPKGAELSFTRDPDKKCRVVDNKRVEFRGETFSLSKLARKLLLELGYDWKTVRGTAFFKYNDKILSEIYNEIENKDEDDD